MTTWTAKAPIRRRSKRVFGRVYFRLICGSCGDRSRWGRHGRAAHWIRQHYLHNTYCTKEMR